MSINSYYNKNPSAPINFNFKAFSTKNEPLKVINNNYSTKTFDPQSFKKQNTELSTPSSYITPSTNTFDANPKGYYSNLFSNNNPLNNTQKVKDYIKKNDPLIYNSYNIMNNYLSNNNTIKPFGKTGTSFHYHGQYTKITNRRDGNEKKHYSFGSFNTFEKNNVLYNNINAGNFNNTNAIALNKIKRSSSTSVKENLEHFNSYRDNYLTSYYGKFGVHKNLRSPFHNSRQRFNSNAINNENKTASNPNVGYLHKNKDIFSNNYKTINNASSIKTVEDINNVIKGIPEEEKIGYGSTISGTRINNFKTKNAFKNFLSSNTDRVMEKQKLKLKKSVSGIRNNLYQIKNKENHNNSITSSNKATTINEKISDNALAEYHEKDSYAVLEYAYKEDSNMRYRAYMEDKGKAIDCFNGDPESALFALFDGHGGDSVSKFLQNNISNYFKNILDTEDFSSAEEKEKIFPKLFRILDQKIKENNFTDIGSTACVCYITKVNGKKYIYCANVGDTRCVLLRDMDVKRLSYDHRAADKAEYDRILSEGGIVIAGRVYGQLMLSRAFGDWELKSYGVISEPHITRMQINNSDKYLIIASDGVWDVIEDDDIFNLNRNATNSEELCGNIIRSSLDKGSMDNISCFVIKLN